MAPRLLLLLLLLTSTAFAQDLTGFEKVLIPVLNLNPITGYNGVVFSTFVGVLPTDVQPITYYPAPGAGGPVVGTNQPQLFALPMWEAPVVAKGRFLFVRKRDAAAPIFASAGATAPDGTANSVSLPVVHEKDVLTGQSFFGVLPNRAICTQPPVGFQVCLFLGWGERHTLRVYDWDSTGRLEVAVRLRYSSWLDRRVVKEQRVAVNRRDFDDPSYPFYAEVDPAALLKDGWCYPQLHTQCGSFGAILEIEPVTPDAHYYAFVSTTDNTTGQLTIWPPR